MWKREKWEGYTPLPRSGCAGCCLGKYLVYFGGNACTSGENFLSDTYIYDTDSNQSSKLEVLGDVPYPMDRHTAVEYNGEMWIFGGDRGWTLTNKLWKLNLVSGTGVWSEVHTSTSPTPRRGHTSVKCSQRKSIIVFGGVAMKNVPVYLGEHLVTESSSVNDTWELILDQFPLSWNLITPQCRSPPPRRGHSAVVLEPNEHNPNARMYVFGGYCEDSPTVGNTQGIWRNDLWRYDPGEREWTQIVCWGDVPPPTVGHNAAVTNRSTFVIFGGGDCETNENSLYECYENGLWRRIEAMRGSIPPTPRSYASFIIKDNRLYVHGGCNNDHELSCLYSLSLDFRNLFPPTLLNLLSEYIILNRIPYKQDGVNKCEESQYQVAPCGRC